MINGARIPLSRRFSVVEMKIERKVIFKRQEEVRKSPETCPWRRRREKNMWAWMLETKRIYYTYRTPSCATCYR